MTQFFYWSQAITMFRNAYQTGFLSVLYSIGSNPLQIWNQTGASYLWKSNCTYKQLKKNDHGNHWYHRAVAEDCHIERVIDDQLQSTVIEIKGKNVPNTYISCPADPTKTLAIMLPFLVLQIKNVEDFFSFEVQVLDDKNEKRRLRASTFQVLIIFNAFCTLSPSLLFKIRQQQVHFFMPRIECSLLPGSIQDYALCH